MPIYEYQCQTCGKRSELLQRMDDPPMAACPHCGGPVKKLISSPAVQFKGSGWYVTDYAKKGASGSGGSKGEGAKAGEGGGESKAAEKPASEGASSSTASSETKAAKSSD
jgi:putative FmdB family regulatory protein